MYPVQIFTGNLTANLIGNVTGNADTATTLTARTTDGSANINLPGVNASGNQDTTGNAACYYTSNCKDYWWCNLTRCQCIR